MFSLVFRRKFKEKKGCFMNYLFSKSIGAVATFAAMAVTTAAIPAFLL